MKGISSENGQYLSDLDHLKQSLVNILTTPIGTRVMCRDYGSHLFELVDQPVNRELIPKIYAAVAEAIDQWEPRFKLEKITIDSIKEGHITLSLSGKYLITQEKIVLEDLVI